MENQTGYHNLCRILSQETRGGNPEIRNPKSESPSVSNSVPPLLRVSDFGLPSAFGLRTSDLPTDGLLAVSPAAELAPFFPDRFYLEVSSPDAFDKRPAPLPCVASFPIHYEQPADRWKYDVVQSIRTLTLLRQAHPEKRLDGEYHFRSQPKCSSSLPRGRVARAQPRTGRPLLLRLLPRHTAIPRLHAPGRFHAGGLPAPARHGRAPAPLPERTRPPQTARPRLSRSGGEFPVRQARRHARRPSRGLGRVHGQQTRRSTRRRSLRASPGDRHQCWENRAQRLVLPSPLCRKRERGQG